MTMIHPAPASPSTNDPSRKGWKVGQALTIGKIYTHKGVEVESLVLPPQGIAHLVSKEIIDLPDDICALAHVQTSKCNDGLLTLNIGVVDPGWSNHVSTSILNFSAERRLLTVGDTFIRLTFHRIVVAPDSASSQERFANTKTDAYFSAVKTRAVEDFGKHFLNIKELVASASKKENARLRDTMLKYLPIAAFSLAVAALLVTIGIANVNQLRLSKATSTQSTMQNLPPGESEARLRAQVDALRKRIDRLESAEQPASESLRQPEGILRPEEPTPTRN